MKRQTLCALFVVGLSLLTLWSCSGGGGGGTGTPVASTTSVTSSGTVTAFGSVFVGSREYQFDNSTSTSVDDGPPVIGPSGQNSLRIGMVVKVSGAATGSSSTASTILQEDTLDGPISSKDTANSRFEVLGQTVFVNETTKFDSGLSFASLNVNDVVEVSGFVKSDGVITASFIERKAIGGGCTLGCEVKGTVKNHNHATTSFQIGSLTVTYGSPADISDMPAPSGSNWNGLFVEVKGTGFVAGTLAATKVEPEGFQAPNGNRVELEGFVTSTLGVGRFILGTTEVQATNAEYLGGTIDEVAVGQKLEVEGSILNNVITATKVKFKDTVRIESNVVSKTATTLTVDGLAGITITVNSQTEFKNVANLAALAVGNNVRIRGREGAGNTVIATEIELRNATPDPDVELQGAVQAVANPSLTILGVQVNTNGFSDPGDFQGLDDQPIGRAAFFNAVKVGTVVKAKGQLNGGVIFWREVELESD